MRMSEKCNNNSDKIIFVPLKEPSYNLLTSLILHESCLKILNPCKIEYKIYIDLMSKGLIFKGLFRIWTDEVAIAVAAV